MKISSASGAEQRAALTLEQEQRRFFTTAVNYSKTVDLKIKDQ